MGYVITLTDAEEVVDGADAYLLEGPFTTFVATAPGRGVVDSWSTRLASFRTRDITAIRALR